MLVDCGLFQGGKSLRDQNRVRTPFDPKQIDAVVLTHVHIDHLRREEPGPADAVRHEIKETISWNIDVPGQSSEFILE